MHFGKYLLKRISALANVAQIVGVSSHALEVCRFDSGSGHKPNVAGLVPDWGA